MNEDDDDTTKHKRTTPKSKPKSKLRRLADVKIIVTDSDSSDSSGGEWISTNRKRRKILSNPEAVPETLSSTQTQHTSGAGTSSSSQLKSDGFRRILGKGKDKGKKVRSVIDLLLDSAGDDVDMNTNTNTGTRSHSPSQVAGRRSKPGRRHDLDCDAISSQSDDDENDIPHTKFRHDPATSKLWTELHEPVLAEDLAINKRRVNELRDAFVQALSGKFRLVLVTGPVGCGKSTAIRVLAKELGVVLQEWVTPVAVSVKDAEKPVWYTSVLRSFGDFLQSAGRYSVVTSGQGDFGDGLHALVIDDLPYLYGKKEKDQFSHILRKYIAGGFSRKTTAPLFIILSDAEGTNTLDLFPSDIQCSPLVARISVKASAMSFVRKALRRIAVLEGWSLQSREVKEYISEACVVCNGDVRSAVLDMQLNYMGKSPMGKGRSKDKGKGKGKGKVDTKSETVAANNTRDGQLGFMHAIGRIMHAKRLPPVTTANQSGGGGSSSSSSRGALSFSPESIVDCLASELDVTLRFLHANALDFQSKSYAASPDFPQIDVVSDTRNVADSLSQADVLSRWNWTYRNNSSAIASTGWLSEASALVGIRGWLEHNHLPRIHQFASLIPPKRDGKALEEKKSLLKRYLYERQYTTSCSSITTLATDVMKFPGLSTLSGQTADYTQLQARFRFSPASTAATATASPGLVVFREQKDDPIEDD